MYIENKYDVTLNSFASFAYVSSYLHLNDFAWKKKQYLKNYECHKVQQDHSGKHW